MNNTNQQQQEPQMMDQWETMDSSSVSSSTDAYSSDDLAAPLSPTVSESFDSDAVAHSKYKKVLVTGGAGFIGGAVADALLARGDDVVIVDEVNDYYDVRIKRRNLSLLMEKYGEQRCKVYEGDICDVPFISALFERERPQWICHMAARAGVRPSIEDPFIYVHSNIEGTTRLLELARKYNCRNFSFASSSSVYGGSENEYFSEKDLVDFPVSPYAASKKACELMAHTYHHLYQMNICALRFFTVYGPRGRPDMAPFKFIDSVSRGKEIMQFGDGSTSRDYTYISDIVDGVVRSLDRPLGYQIYNLGRGEPTSLSRFINLVEENVGQNAKIKICPEQPGDVPRTCADISKARTLLGYEPQVSFEDGIRLTVQWYKEEYSTSSLVKSTSFAMNMNRTASCMSMTG
jgi:UDP-glucuronate 4-epimerase